MLYRTLTGLVAVSLLAGCQWLPAQTSSTPPTLTELPSGCQEEWPSLTVNACQTEAWVAFGLASQRGDRDWRDRQLARLDGDDTQERLVRAVVLSWGTESEWNKASELYKADLEKAPEELQPLLRYWLNELEGRRALSAKLAEQRQSRQALTEQNAAQAEQLEEMAHKLEALSDIEQSINLRQQAP
ncbi:hypothetical protein SAMN05216571_102159 [Onishia taeanensis]|uniref:YfhG lipoprotein n=1 Tax=Onishia taeanensis TaxID=284577 RepID=A0A1G7P737_9GAMM|nr:hypothetical protein [Halomonas taeanensis]SDF82088.1 hypothetical protein SAMN05216571_102159 [Halomonas taeanensis]